LRFPFLFLQAEAAAAAGERAVRGFMVAVQRATSNVALVQQVSYLFLRFFYIIFTVFIVYGLVVGSN